MYNYADSIDRFAIFDLTLENILCEKSFSPNSANSSESETLEQDSRSKQSTLLASCDQPRRPRPTSMQAYCLTVNVRLPFIVAPLDPIITILSLIPAWLKFRPNISLDKSSKLIFLNLVAYKLSVCHLVHNQRSDNRLQLLQQPLRFNS